MKIMSGIRSLLKLWVLIPCLVAMLQSCDNAIYDDQAECVLKYMVNFKYDTNLKFADAFAHEVNQVTLYVIDGNGNVVWQKTESGEKLAANDYAMEVDVPAGKYNLLAWCSSENPTTFTTASSKIATELKTNFLADKLADGTNLIKNPLDRLYHGYVEGVEFPDVSEGVFTKTVPLTKDTNTLMVSLQQVGGEPLDKDLVEFEITDDNTYLDWDNNPIAGNNTIYRSWYKETIEADVPTQQSRAEGDEPDVTTFAGVIAELTTSRLMANHSNTARLKVYRTDTGEVIANIKLIDALLLARNSDNRHNLTAQQYLDYKDDYNLTFFLDANHKWLGGLIQIEGWRYVYSEQVLD